MTDCIFCKIIKGELPSKKVYEDSRTFAFLDINPRNPGHTIVVPKNHSQDIFSVPEEDAAALAVATTRVARGVRKATGAKGISISQSNGQLAGQRMPHIHFHVIPRTEAEKGVGFDEFIPMKKAEEADLINMAKKISGAIPKGRPEPVREAPEPEPEDEEAPEEEKQETSSESGDDQRPEKQRIDFNF